MSAECRVCELGYGAVYNLDGGLASLHSLLQLAGFSTPGQLPDVSARGAESKSKLLGKRWLLISKSCRAELSLGSWSKSTRSSEQILCSSAMISIFMIINSSINLKQILYVPVTVCFYVKVPGSIQIRVSKILRPASELVKCCARLRIRVSKMLRPAPDPQLCIWLHI